VQEGAVPLGVFRLEKRDFGGNPQRVTFEADANRFIEGTCGG